MGTASGDVIALIIGGVLLLAVIIYFITVPKYLHNLDKKITLLKEQLEKHKKDREYLEGKHKYTDPAKPRKKN